MPTFKYAISTTTTRRGAGLGNELHGYAKAHLAAQELGARALPPAWGLNPRGYWRYFGTSRLDWLHHWAIASGLPSFRFDEEQYRATGEDDFRRAVRTYAERHALHTKSAFSFMTGGMWGGMAILRPAFPFVRKLLYSARGTAANLSDLHSRIPTGNIVIAVHVRRGEFTAAVPDPSQPLTSQWSWAISTDWYINVCRSIASQLTVPHSFVVFTDGTAAEMEPLVDELAPITLFDQRMNVCSDLLAMASADLLVCSRSSFSIWAAALSDRPYIWPAEGLHRGTDFVAIWDHGTPIRGNEDATRQKPRGVPVDSQGAVPTDVVGYLEEVYSRRGLSTDLVFYGHIPRQAEGENAQHE